jgi:tRNA A-37 threonylcarbamoyl transferase component Bud32
MNYIDAHTPNAEHERFLNNLRSLTTLRHAALSWVYDYFHDGCHMYIVMEYIEGHVLGDGLTYTKPDGAIVSGRPYLQEDVLRWGIALCHLIEYLASHDPPVVHGNITPNNLILDRRSGAVRLVGFGAQWPSARAPHEDHYDLAATLYQLASDHNPQPYPHCFPRLDALGPLGLVLQPMLHADPEHRPAISVFRQQLAALLRPVATSSLQAPDGSIIPDRQTLVRWCEYNWEQAEGWLYGKLPDQIEAGWRRPELARYLRDLVEQRSVRTYGLDAMLDRLDPHGYGAAIPWLRSHTESINFGTLGTGARISRDLHINNLGSHCVRCHIQTPSWLKAHPPSIKIYPAHHAVVRLEVQPRQLPADRGQQGTVVVEAPRMPPLKVAVQAASSPWWSVWRNHLALIIIVVLVYLWMLCLLVNSIYWSFYKHTNDQSGVTALEQKDWLSNAEKLEEAASLRQENGMDTDTQSLMREGCCNTDADAAEQSAWAETPVYLSDFQTRL